MATVTHDGEQYEQISPGVYYSPTRGWIEGGAMGDLLDSLANKPQQYQWSKTNGGWVNQHGHFMEDSVFNPIAQQYGVTSPNGVITGYESQGSDPEQAFISGMKVKPGEVGRIDPEKGLMYRGDQFEQPSGFDLNKMIMPALLAGLGPLAASAGTLGGAASGGLAGLIEGVPGAAGAGAGAGASIGAGAATGLTDLLGGAQTFPLDLAATTAPAGVPLAEATTNPLLQTFGQGAATTAATAGAGQLAQQIGTPDFNPLGNATDVTNGSIPPVPSTTGTNLIDAATGASGGVSGAMGAGQAVGAGAATAGGSWWDTIAEGLGLSQGAKNTLGTLGSALGIGQGNGMLNSILEYMKSGKNADLLKQQLEAAANRGDPAAGERGFYQNLLRTSYTDPNFLKNDPTFAGMRDIAVNDARRVAAAKGYGNSSNLLYDIADRVQKQGANYLLPWQGQVAQNAGMNISPGASAAIQAQGAQTIASANSKQSGALGNVIENIPNVLKTLNQGLA